MISEDAHWKHLILAFVEGRIDGPAFERRFLDIRGEEINRGLSQRYAVDLLFYEVDAYCADPALAGPDDINEDQLRREAVRCLERWSEPWPKL
jgi:hypothetical protein